ncbi:ABC transporter permease [Actinomadura meridiana]|uniref:ABC transporter permease n=1 Tax=Actinomadura meridiana TaxID=559626 RepID=A0ABP8CQR0_9ACTN
MRSEERPRGGLRRTAEHGWLVAVAAVAWELATRAAKETYFPPPTTIAGSLRELWFSGPASRLFLSDNAVDDFSTSLTHLFVGWAAAGAAGIVAGAAIGRSRFLDDLLNPVLEFLRAVPPVTLVIVLPAAAPKVFAGLRVALSFALILMVVSELVGSTSGIGSELIGAQRTFELPRMWAGIVMLGILGFLFNAAFVLLERRLLSWHAGARRLPT